MLLMSHWIDLDTILHPESLDNQISWYKYKIYKMK
jgi:hypothetical protein